MGLEVGRFAVFQNSMNTNTEVFRDLELGMNYGAAQGRLYRLVLFTVVQKAGLDTCYRCGKKIKTARELSIDHKEPWYKSDPALFWDMNNIAFSHLSCNCSHRRKGLMTPEVRENRRKKIVAALTGNTWNRGKKRSKEHLQKMADGRQRRLFKLSSTESSGVKPAPN